MSKWRKKPVVVEAEVYRVGLEDGVDFTYEQIAPNVRGLRRVKKPYIDTLEGRMFISPGDYIITGVEGERYPCKPDIFEKTYEKI